MTLVQFQEIHKECFNAGSKAVEDVNAIIRKLGARTWRVVRFTEVDFPLPRWINRAIGAVVWKVQELIFRWRFPRNAVLFLQHPLGSSRALMRNEVGVRFVRWLKKCRGVKIITLIHDISELRGAEWKHVVSSMPDSIDTVIGYSDVLIAHNDTMRNWLLARGVESSRVVVLAAFDYLTDEPLSEIDEQSRRSITFAGNLRPDKCGFLKRSDEVVGVDWYLYGPKFDSKVMNGATLHYCGCLKPSELPAHLSRGFGLVWDGDDLEGCTGDWGEYLKWNNPHKLSLYLASGLPVITWSKAATAKFVQENDVGIAVESLKELSTVLGRLSPERYRALRQNAQKLARKLREGDFLSSAVRKAMELV